MSPNAASRDQMNATSMLGIGHAQANMLDFISAGNGKLSLMFRFRNLEGHRQQNGRFRTKRCVADVAHP